MSRYVLFARRTLRVATLLVTAGLVLGWFLVLRPTSFGGPAGYALVSGPSMEPTYRTGDLIVTQRAEAYGVGDIVLFRVKNALVIHRIVGGDPVAGYVTRGDNNGVEDGFRPTASAIEGKAWLHLTGIGKAVIVVRQPLPLAICTWLLASFLLLRRWSTPRSASTGEPGGVADA
jgi:signal peptidase I